VFYIQTQEDYIPWTKDMAETAKPSRQTRSMTGTSKPRIIESISAPAPAARKKAPGKKKAAKPAVKKEAKPKKAVGEKKEKIKKTVAGKVTKAKKAVNGAKKESK